jgi:NitT/TauT family transport system ATP-binding protein
MTCISLGGVSVEYSDDPIPHREVIRGLDLYIAPSAFVVLVGPSGCGKTTLLRLMSGLLQPTTGQVTFGNGPTSTELPHLSVVFQTYSKSLFPWLTAEGNIHLALRPYALTAAEMADRTKEALEIVGLAGSSQVYPDQLSGGMQQRLTIARAIARRATLWLLDEPLGSVDAYTRLKLQVDLSKMWEAIQPRPTVVMVSHDIDEALFLGDRVLVMSPAGGRIIGDVQIDLGRPRDHILTRSEETYLRLRVEIVTLLETASVIK